MQHKLPEAKLALEAKQNKVTQSIKPRPKPFRPNKAFKRKKNKNKGKNTISGLLILQITDLNQKLSSSMKTDDSTKILPGVATKPTKHKQKTEVRLFNFSRTIFFFFRHAEKRSARYSDPDLRVQRQRCYLKPSGMET